MTEENKRGRGRPRKWQDDAQRMAVARIAQRVHADNVRQVHLLIQRLAKRGDALYIKPWDLVGETEEETFKKLADYLRGA